MDTGQRAKRRIAVRFWRLVNPPTRWLAGVVPWWVLLETVGHRTGRLRRTPIARGPIDDTGIWLIAAHGRHASWVKNIQARPTVRVRHRRSWRDGTARVQDLDAQRLARFNVYARQAAKTMGIDPMLVRIDWRTP
jgi:deazaflavin-dependent oxidoreductase (nitroreductase family)